MPYYEYLCDKGHEFEVEQGIKDDALTECAELVPIPNIQLSMSRPTHDPCGASCQRLISKTSFILKGAGWTGKGGV